METDCCIWQIKILLVEHVSAVPWQKRSLSCWVSEFILVLWKKGSNWEAAFHCVAFWRVCRINCMPSSSVFIINKHFLFSRHPPHFTLLFILLVFVFQLAMMEWFFRASSTGQHGKRAAKIECKGKAGESITMIVLSLNMDVTLGLNEGAMAVQTELPF